MAGVWLDMAMYIFADKIIIRDEPIPIYNHGNMMRDFASHR